MFALIVLASAVLTAAPLSEMETIAGPELTALATAGFHFEPAAVATSIESSTNSFAQTTSPDLTQTSVHHPFGEAESKYWFVSGGGGSDLGEDGLGRLSFGYSYFAADGFSFDFELAGLYFSQPENDAYGINFNFIMRWHFWQNEARTVSFYGDAGAGLFCVTEDVPEDGDRFNFTPQAGVGMSFDIGHDLRLFAGARWHHVSNARLFESNPGTDSVLFYAMLSWPF